MYYFPTPQWPTQCWRRDAPINFFSALNLFPQTDDVSSSSSASVSLFLRICRCRLDEHTAHHHHHHHQKGREDEDAGRRVYEQLLLNAWRHRRKEAKGLTEMCRKLQEEVCEIWFQNLFLNKVESVQNVQIHKNTIIFISH